MNDDVPPARLNSSTVEMGCMLAPTPPARRTSPLGSRVEVWEYLATLIAPATVQLPEIGSYKSALDLTAPPAPPDAYTLPFGNRVAACMNRGSVIMFVTTVQLPVDGS